MRNQKASENKTGCTFMLTGEVTEIYEGKNADYATVKAQRGEYYDLFRVSVNDRTKITGSYAVGKNCIFSGTVSTFWNKEKKVSVYNLTADSVNEV